MKTQKLLLCMYVSSTLELQDDDTVDATAKKLMMRMEEIEQEMFQLRMERDAITTALKVAGIRPSDAHPSIYSREETQYRHDRPFAKMSLTDACLHVLRDYSSKAEISEQWLDKNQVEYLVTRGGYDFKADDPTNSVNVTLRRLAEEGYCEAHAGKGSRATRYHFKKERVPEAVAVLDSRATKT